MVNGYSRSSQTRKDKRKTKDHTSNYVDRVRLGQSSLQNVNHNHPPRGSGWRQKSISNLDLSASRKSSSHYIEQDRQLRPSRSLDYKHSNHKEDHFDIAEFYWRIDPDRDYSNLPPHSYLDESGYHSTNLYNQPFDIGNESCSLRRSRSLAVIREETFSDLQISTTNSNRRSQLIPRARLVNRGFFNERFTSSKQPTYYHHHHHLHHRNHQPPTTLDRPLAVAPTEPQTPQPDAVAPPPDTTTITRESDEYYENLKRLDAHQQSIWQNEKSDLESLNSEYFSNSHHQSDSNVEKQRLYQSHHRKSTRSYRKYSSQLAEESCPELSQSSAFPETTTTSNSDDQSDSLTNSEQEYDIERVEEILSKVYDEKFEVISLTDEQHQKRQDNSEEQRTLIAYDSVYLSSEDSSEGTIVEEKPETTSLLHISIEDICDPPQRPEPQKEPPAEKPVHSQVVKVPAVNVSPPVANSKPKILALVEKKKLKRLSDYAAVPSQRRGVLEHLTFISTQSTHHYQSIDNQYFSLPDVHIGQSLKASERIDAKLRSSYNLKEDQATHKETPETTAIHDSIKRFGRAHKKVRQREQETNDEAKDINRAEADEEKPREAPSIQVESYSKQIHKEAQTNTTPIELGQFRIIVTDAQNNVIEEDSIDGHIPSLNSAPESANGNHSNQQQADTNKDTDKLVASTPKRTLARTLSKPKRLVGTITVKTHSEVCKAKDRRVYNTYRARPIKVKPNDSLRCAGKMSRPQVIQVVDSQRRGSMEKPNPLAGKAAEDEFLQKVDAIRCYWSKLNQENNEQNRVNSEELPTRKDFVLGEETKSLAPVVRPQFTEEDFQSLLPSIEIVELDGEKHATIVKANPDDPVPEFDHIRYKVMKPNLFRSNIMNRSKKEAQFDGLIQYLQEYSFQELLTNNNVVIVEPVRTKVERPPKALSEEQPTKAGGQHCKITGGAGNTNNPTVASKTPSDGHNKLSKRHFYYQPVRVNRELLEEELPTPDTVRNVRKFFEENVLPKRREAVESSMGMKCFAEDTPNQSHAEGRRNQRNRFRYLTIDTSYGNGSGAAPLRKWDSVSLSSGISSGDLSSPCECSNGDAGAVTVDGRSPQHQQPKNDYDGVDVVDGHERKQQDIDVRGGMHVRDFIRRHNACGSQDSNGLGGDYLLDAGEHQDQPEDDDDVDDEDDELCESYYVSEDVLEKIRECGSTVTYYGGRVTMHSPPATGATLRIPRSKIDFLTCQPNECPHKDQLHDQRNYTGLKFKLVKSNSCSSRLELIGTQRLNNHETHHPTTIGEDDSIDGNTTTTHREDHHNDDDEYDDGEPLVRRLVHRLETTGKINSYTGPRIIESQCIEKTRRPTSLMEERQKFEVPGGAHKRLSEGFTINNQMVGKADTRISDPLAYVQLLKQVTVNNHISAPVESHSESPCFTSSAMDIRLVEKTNGSSDTKLANGKIRRNKNVDLAFTMKGPNGSMKLTNGVQSKATPLSGKVDVKPANTTATDNNNTKNVARDSTTRNVTIVEHFDVHLPREDAAAATAANNISKATSSSDLIVDNSLVRHYVTNDKRLFTQRKYDDIEFEEFEVYDPSKDAAEKAEQLVNGLVDDLARAASASSSDEHKSNPPDECYDSLDDKI